MAYTFINHALTIISLLKNLQNTSLLSKYEDEQKYIKEFLNIIDNVNIITESDYEENEEEEEKEKEEKSVKEKNGKTKTIKSNDSKTRI